MKIYKYITSVAILSFCFLSACNKPTETKIPVPVIFDTDVGNDIDDVLAMQMLFNYEKAGTIDLLGITISKSNPYSIEYIDGYCHLNETFHWDMHTTELLPKTEVISARLWIPLLKAIRYCILKEA